MKKKSIGILFIFVFLTFLTGCPPYEGYDNKAVDELTKSVKSEFNDSYYFREMTVSETGEYYYEFQINEYDEDHISRFVNLLDEQVINRYDKITVYVGISNSQGFQYAFTLKNYSDGSLDKADYDGFYYLRIAYMREYHDQFWDDIYIYSSLENIKILEISDDLQKQLDQNGVNCYEIWPELKEIYIYEVVNSL